MNRHFAPRILYVLLILSFALVVVPPAAAAPDAPQVSTTVVISQFQVAGGSAADEFIELHNVGTSNLDLNGYRVVYRSATGTSDVGLVSWAASTIIVPGGYYLVAHTSYDGTPAADITFNLGTTGSLSGTSGGLAIRNGALNTGTIVDSVGYGSATNAFVETATTTVPAANASKARLNNGCQDTDNNSNDFELVSPSTPRNSSTTAISCAAGDAAPSVTSTTPTNGATVATTAPVSVTFSEGVTFNSTVEINCTVSGIQNITPAGGPTTWTLSHAAFQAGETCTVTIDAADVSDVDTNDPPDFMAAPYSWSFTIDAAPSVTSTTPLNGATGVAVGANLSVTFSEAVNVSNIDSFFDIYCEVSGVPTLQPAAGSGGPTTFTINPTADLPAGSSCTVTIYAAQVTDQDANDPPDNMAANYVFTFATAAVDAAPYVSSTVPTNGATGVAAGADLSVTFSEAVNVSNIDSFFDIYCDAVLQPAAGSGGPTTFTINPTADLPAGSSCTVTIYAAQVTDQDANDPPDNMAADYSWDFTVAEPVTLIINELDSDTPGTDVAEFIELYDGGIGNTSLTGMVIVLFNGNGDVSYGAFDLDGRSTNAAGYFVICGNAANVANCNWDVTPDSDLIQNGADAAALYLANATDFPNGTAVSTTNLVDAIVYDTADADDAGLLALLNAGQPQVDESSNGNSANESNQRCPNGSGGQRNTSTYLQHTPTSGAANYCPEYAPPVVSSTSPANGATGVAVGTTITINFNKLVDVAAGAFTVECPAGTTVSFTANPALPAGDITSVVLTPSSALPASTTCTVTALAPKITDNNSPAQQLDGNGDGTGGDNYVFIFTTAAVDPCTLPATLISEIQGSGASSPYAGNGTSYTIQGIVVGDYEEGGIKGYFVQEEDADGDGNAATSEGIFVYDNNATSEVSLGDKVRLTGTVSEYYTLTEVTISTAATICSSGNSVTPASVSLPVAALADLEPYEGMKVTFPQTLTVTDNYDLGYYGQLTLSANGKLWQFTHLNTPDVAGYTAYLNGLPLRTIVLDDGGTATNPDPIVFPGTGLTAGNTVRVDDTITGLTGVLDYRYDLFRVQKVGQVDFTPSNPRPVTAPAVGGNIKVGAFNTLNFFVTTGAGYTCGPYSTLQCRGASNATEYTRQLDKLVAAICGLNADVLGLMELENPDLTETTDPVLGALVAALNASPACVDDYAFIDNAWAGTDAIRQGLIYKPNVVTPVGTTVSLISTAFINGGDSSPRNRPALTQAFQVISSGERFILSVNHLKSKGSACTVPDALDGQANCAVVRTNAANALTAWLATNPTGIVDPDILIMGDLNSYAKEDPITALVNAGYTDLINWTVGSSGYGYAFDGMMGYLDHALGSSTLLAQVTAADEWHINSPEPDVLDYNTEYKSASQILNLYNADPYRSTDHDAVLVGLGLGLNPDLGDLAASYGAAWHTGQGVVWKLGSLWTGEASSTPGSDNPSDDGVVRNYSESWNDTRGEVNVTVTGPAAHWACLNAWLDYSDGSAVAGVVETPNGLFDANEHVVNNLPIQAGAGQLVTWPLESGVINDTATYNMRFRLVPAPDPAVASCSGVTLAPAAPDGGGSATGVAYGGEVEDYSFTAGPLAVDLASFTATVAAEGVTLAWETVSETGNAGFNVYRAETPAAAGLPTEPPADAWVKLNDTLIAAAAPGSSEGHSYAFTDATAAQGATYWYALEDVALDGTATRHAPVSVTVAEPNAVGLAAFAAAPLAGSMPALAGLAALAMAALAGVGLRRR